MAGPLPLTAPDTDGAVVRPLPPDRPPDGWIVLGPRVREHLGPALERAMPLVWVALLEMSGAADGAPYRLVVDAAHIEPAPAGGPAG